VNTGSGDFEDGDFEDGDLRDNGDDDSVFLSF
jgi:hypothetical protein